MVILKFFGNDTLLASFPIESVTLGDLDLDLFAPAWSPAAAPFHPATPNTKISFGFHFDENH